VLGSHATRPPARKINRTPSAVTRSVDFNPPRVAYRSCGGGPDRASVSAQRRVGAMSTVLVTGGSGFIGGHCILHYFMYTLTH